MQLNLSSAYSVQDVAELLASGNDATNTQLRITKEGIAYLSKEVGSSNLVGIATRLETWLAGNGYVGIEASKDLEWVTRIFNVLQKNWPNPTFSYIDHF